jgi:hypothetical protein
MRPPLWATLAGVVDAVRPAGEAGELLRVSGVSLDLPVEIELRRTADGVEILGQPPAWRWETAFDRRPARLTVRLRAEGAS